eukprot:TRINITY_DN5864_c0_g1_i1.p1 TRINITY_DN5864_c0_g1~~TRINITY_DN5864_c0_g1_i1.p1  ORF type:complete len:95 (-),score=8.43 TRINITY_DN5864_c0_g1_i1:176-460(-)
MGNIWRRLLVVNFRALNGFGMVTIDKDAAFLLGLALCIPRKSVLNSVRKHFKDLETAMTCSTFISELQKPKNDANLPLSWVCIAKFLMFDCIKK